jgi:hypothetical protein
MENSQGMYRSDHDALRYMLLLSAYIGEVSQLSTSEPNKIMNHCCTHRVLFTEYNFDHHVISVGSHLSYERTVSAAI